MLPRLLQCFRRFFPLPVQRAIPGDRLHAIYAASYRPTGRAFPLAWAPGDNSVHGEDVTTRYLDTPAAGAPDQVDGIQVDGAITVFQLSQPDATEQMLATT